MARLLHLTQVDMSIVAKGESLDGQTAWSSEFTWKEIEQLAGHTSAYAAKKGTTIVHEGDIERYMGIVLTGGLDVVKKNSAGKATAVSQISRGKTFGEMSLVDGEPRSATLVAGADATLLVISLEDLNRMADEAPRLGFKFMLKVAKLISQRLRQATGILADKK